MGKTIKVDVLKNNFKVYSKKAQLAYLAGLNDCIDNLVTASSQSAPHDEGILEKSWSKEIQYAGNKPSGVVSYSVKKASGSGNYNYALKMHEGGYNLGEGSLAKQASGGGVGLSGKRYNVGAGFLGDVAKGERKAYADHIESKLHKAGRTL